jgi:hypothetical protein
MKYALKLSLLRGVRTMIQALAGVAAAVPAVSSFVDAKTAGVVALWGAFGAVVAGVGSFLQNFAEQLEEEDVLSQ